MNNHPSLIAALLLCTTSIAHSQMNPQANPPNEQSTGVTISLLEQKLTDKTLQLRYQIRNDSGDDIWICGSMDFGSDWDAEVYVGQDNETLFVQRWLDAPMRGISRNQPIGRYVRVGRGGARTETMSFHLPVHHQRVFLGARGLRPSEHASRLVLEIGYYEGNLPETVFQMLEEAERAGPTKPGTVPAYGTGLVGALGGSVYFNSPNEVVNDRDEQVIIPWTDQALRGEKVVQMVVNDLAIPYSAEYVERTRIHLSPLKRIEVHFRRLPLEFFFPYARQQSLLSPKEKQYLQSLKDFVLEDKWDLMGIAYDASEAVGGIFFTEGSMAEMICHRKDDSTVSLAVYDDAYIVTQEGQVFRCLKGLTRLRMLAPQVQGLDQRVQCAVNLTNLWYRFRLHRIARHAPKTNEQFWNRYLEHGYIIPPDTVKAGEMIYPPASEWCDALGLTACVCPAAGKGLCHYAMNADCRPDSPADTVLLFETKAGWNQHGGPELFTFDNHDPKGGLVLLHDGTVTFIHTKQELRQLRWK